jgi:hypothetical protein
LKAQRSGAKKREQGKLFEHKDLRVVCRPDLGEHRRGLGGQDVRQALARDIFSFGSFSLDKQRKGTRPPTGGRNHFFFKQPAFDK